MTDDETKKAPERLFVARGMAYETKALAMCEDDKHHYEYVRADIHQAVVAERDAAVAETTYTHSRHVRDCLTACSGMLNPRAEVYRLQQAEKLAAVVFERLKTEKAAALSELERVKAERDALRVKHLEKIVEMDELRALAKQGAEALIAAADYEAANPGEPLCWCGEDCGSCTTPPSKTCVDANKFLDACRKLKVL